jgi:DNA-binding winged helix-turn-helix (wHTH) protein/Flp pilus assembly protein TadD
MVSESISYYFEEFCFDTGNGQLLKNGSPVSITAKALEVLLVLVQEHGRFVRKEELIERVWSERFVEEANLTQHVYILRKTLGQTAGGQAFIETMPKRGYRFTARVSERKTEQSQQTIKFDDFNNENEFYSSVSGNREAVIGDNNQAQKGKIVGYRFDDFKLDIQRRMLYRDSQPIMLPAKAFETLLYLVENSSQLVKKNDLMDKIWQERYVEENNLTQKIFILRRILGDNRNEHQYIVTVPGEGYVFVAPVSKYSNEVSVTAFVKENLTDTLGLQKTPVITLAVLPFKTFAPEQFARKEDFWGIGLADALTSQLSRYNELIVRPTLSVIQFHNKDRDLSTLSQKIQVSHLVEGIIQHFDSKLKISVQLFESDTGGIVWAEDFVGDNVDFLESQNQISNRISKALAQRLNFEPLPSENSLPKNFEAFQEYIKGKFHWNTRTIEGLKRGIAHAQNALAIEPTFAMAYVGLADCYNLLAGQHSFMPPKNAFPKAKASSQSALEISGDSLAEAYTSLAFTTFNFDWNRPLAQQYFQRAIELRPNYPTAHHWYGEMLAAEGRFDESIKELKKAQELDPLSPAISADLAHAFLLAGRTDESRFLLDQILDINPRFVRALYLVGLVYEQSNQFDKAIETLRRAVEMAPDEPAILAELGCAFAYAGDKNNARSVLKDLQEMRKKRYLSEFLIAMIYLALNQKDEVFEHLEMALQNRDVWLTWINVFTKLNPLRDDSRFAPFVAKIGIN